MRVFALVVERVSMLVQRFRSGAIYINGNTSHLVADLPKIQEPEEVKAGSPSDDFPF